MNRCIKNAAGECRGCGGEGQEAWDRESPGRNILLATAVFLAPILALTGTLILWRRWISPEPMGFSAVGVGVAAAVITGVIVRYLLCLNR